MSGLLLAALLGPTTLGCGGDSEFDLSGVWRFEVAVLPAADDDCDERLLHNLEGALEDDESGDTGDAGGWIEESTTDQSPWTGLGRFVRDGSGWTLLVDGMMLPQEVGGDAAAPGFTWERSESSVDETTHPSGYRWAEERDATASTRIQITLPNETVQKDAERSGTPVSLTGVWEEQSSSTFSWEEADLWPEELGIGDVGAIPFGTYLTRLDELGYVEAAYNGRTETDCSDDDCVLSVNSTCATSWELTATATDIDPSDDDWENLSWDAGI